MSSLSTSSTVLASSSLLVDDLVIANRILADQGVLDAFGHVSVRHEARPDSFLLARNMAPAQVTAEDIRAFSFDGAAVDGRGDRPYLERFIHGSIYRARPDVQAIVHSHSPAVVPFSVSRASRMRPVCHMSGFLGGDVPRFEIRDVAGDSSDLLVRDEDLGDALARTLGNANIVLMRGHGCTVVAHSLKVVVYRAVYAEVNARLQAQAIQLGDPVYLTDAEARAAAVCNEGQVERPWNLWKEAVEERSR